MLLKSQDVAGHSAGGGLSISTDLGVAACLSQHCSSCTLSSGERNSHPEHSHCPCSPVHQEPPTSLSFLTHPMHKAVCLQSENLLGFAQTPSNVNIRGLQKASLLVPALLSCAFKLLTVLVLITSQSQQLTFLRLLGCVLFYFSF